MKRKLALDPADLTVEAFPTTPEPPRSRGTVHGQESQFTCAGDPTCYPHDTCLGVGCGSGSPSCGCNMTGATCYQFYGSCWQTCNCGLTHTCQTGGATDCPGQTNCAPYTQDITCYNSCTDQGCTACGAVC